MHGLVDGARIVSGSVDDTVRVWDAESGAELAVLRGHEAYVSSVCYSPDGARIVSGSHEKPLRVWDAHTGECVEVIHGSGDVAAIARGAAQRPWRALARGSETVLEDAATAQPIAWYPIALSLIATHPSGRPGAPGGSDGSYLCIVQLEGGPS